MKEYFMVRYFFSMFLVSGGWQYVLGGYGLVRLLTGVFAVCPVYIPFNYTTRRGK